MMVIQVNQRWEAVGASERVGWNEYTNKSWGLERNMLALWSLDAGPCGATPKVIVESHAIQIDLRDALPKYPSTRVG